MRLLRGPEAEVLDLAFSPDGIAIAAGFKHLPVVYLWNLEAAAPSPVRLAAEGGYSPGGLFFAKKGRFLWWRRIDGYRGYDREKREYHTLSFAVRGVTHGAFVSADGSRVISRHGIPDHCLIGWEPTNNGWTPLWTVSIADLVVESITLSSDGRQFALLTRSAIGRRPEANPRQLEIWDAATGKVGGQGEYPYAYAPTLLFAPDGQHLVGMNGMTLLVWPVPQLGAPVLIRNDSRKDFTAIAFYPSGDRLYAASNDETIHLFDTSRWERIERFSWRIGRPKSLAVSADGMLAGAGGANGEIVIWDIDE